MVMPATPAAPPARAASMFSRLMPPSPKTGSSAWAQTCRPVPALGTTHADYFYGPVPVTDTLTPGTLIAYPRHSSAENPPASPQ